MGLDRTKVVEEQFLDFIRSWQPHEIKDDHQLDHLDVSKQEWIELFESQIRSRLIDLEARALKNQNLSYYTIGSSGHEGNAVVGRLLRKTDPCLLHYRSGGFMMERGRKSTSDFLYETMLSICASKEDPVSGGRHKVWGSRETWVPPQTSTIASHLPKSVGMAWAIERAKHLKVNLPIPNDSIVCATFGDASCNHSSALTAFNSAQWSVYQKLPVPILFVCEDNGIGISVRTPSGWVARKFQEIKEFHYVAANGLNLADTYSKTKHAIEVCRRDRRPVFLHIKTVRLFGHAGSDVETNYLTQPEIEALEQQDPLVQSAQILLSNWVMTQSEMIELFEKNKKHISDLGKKAAGKAKLTTVVEVTETLFSKNPDAVKKDLAMSTLSEKRKEVFAKSGMNLPEEEKRPRHMAWLINAGLKDLLLKYPEMVMFGEDIAKKGGVYHVTTDLYQVFGAGRVFNTLLDETTILGLASGSAHLGFLPVPEIQYLAYYHNAEDQIRSEAASLSYFSNAQFQNPMVIRVASFGYQKGFGGHFHNDNSIAALMDVPGVMIATPSRGDDAVTMMRTCVAHAKQEGRVVFFLEPIALYMKKDLHESGDGQWQFPYPAPPASADANKGRVYNEDGKDLLIVSYANGLHMSLQAAKILKEKHGISTKVFDLRWLKPLPIEHLKSEIKNIKKILFVDECREFGGVSETLAFKLLDEKQRQEVKTQIVQAVDTYIPLGPAAEVVLPSVQSIVDAARQMG
ncbi:MAG: MFS transporter [Proteobacteria bacterium]|jgi:2-oxoisovalerate dehydrogenase E1 component|nr:MFS transporter [Pseudomonadota bacterium]